MHHIIKPAPITILGKPWPFRQTVESILDADPVFLRPASNARVAARLLASLDESESAKDPVWTIRDDGDKKILAEAAERWVSGVVFTRSDPETGKVIESKEIPTRHFLSHLDAIAEARVNDPRPELEPKKDEPAADAQPMEAPAN